MLDQGGDNRALHVLDVALAVGQQRDLVLVHVQAHNWVATPGESRCQGQAHVTKANDTHSRAAICDLVVEL